MRCPICDEVQHVKIVPSGSTEVLRCEQCYHAWRTTAPWSESSAEKYMGKATWTHLEYMQLHDSIKMEGFKLTLGWANAIRPHAPRLMIDFGCSYGSLMQIFKEDNWDVMGVEISTSAHKILNQRGLPWVTCLEKSSLAPRSVDIVVMFDSIYYLPDPVSTLRQIRSYLKPNSHILIRTPTRGGLIRVLSRFGKKTMTMPFWGWGSFIHHFSRKSTRIALNKAGFTDVKFLKEKGFRHHFKEQLVHSLLQVVDCMTLRLFDLTASWIVTAQATDSTIKE